MRSPNSRNRWTWLLALLLSVGGLLSACGADRPRGKADRAHPSGLVRTSTFRQADKPTLEGGVGWINTAPIALEDLRGKIVLLDFWTYCCINCHHILPDLARLEEKYKDELVVIGVHTAKFFAERDTENIRRKVREYHIRHPVINDANQVLWDRFGVTSWPTIVVLDTDGSYLGSVSGEGHYELLDKVIGKLVRDHKARGDLNTEPVKFFPEIEKPDDTPLLFPGKVLADLASKRLFIADTAHSRIVISDLNGRRARAVGTGVEGLEDGPFDKAQFNRPQGMCLVEDVLYVADTENHALRALDLARKTVKTVAGTGKQTHNYTAHGPGPKTALTSPWDVVHIPESKVLIIAMAGQHQLWRYSLDTEMVGFYAGSGREDVGDGPLHSAAFAQPSGLATDGPDLFVADSEGSAVRVVSLKEGIVRTLAGTHDLPSGRSLFAFGDVDGVADEARLQHCLGLAYGTGKLYVADTYNNKIKTVDLNSGLVSTLAGTKKPGDGDDPPQFYQPGGLSLAGSTLYIADTNNHAIRALDLKTKAVKTLELAGLAPPAPARRPPSFPNATVVKLEPVTLAPAQEIPLKVVLPLPANAKLNAEAPMPYLVETPDQSGILGDDVSASGSRVTPPAASFALAVPLAKEPSPGDAIDLKFSVSAMYCNKGSNLCQIKSFVWNVPVRFQKGGKNLVPLTVPRPTAEPAAER